MDDAKFDTVTRHLALGRSRRQTVRALIGGALGTGLIAVGWRESALGQVEPSQDQCRNLLERCHRGNQCCNPNDTACKRVSRECTNNEFRGEERCCFNTHHPCSSDCECCRGFRCNRDSNTCRKD